MARDRDPSPKDLGLRSDSFVSGFDLDVPRRVIANIEGPQKVGKDHFALTAPDPIVVFNFDCGLEGVIEKFLARGKRIVVAGDPKTRDKAKYPSYRFAQPVPNRGEGRKDSGYLDRVKKAASPFWERWISDMDDFYHSDARTGIVDTGGAAYALGRFAFHGMEKGRPSQQDDPYGQKSGDLKAIFQGIITDGYSYDKNVLWLHRVKEVWKGNKPIGEYTAAGFGDIGYETQITIALTKFSKSGQTLTRATIKDCRLNREAEGEVYEGGKANFSTVMALVTGTDLEDWE